VRSKGGHVRAGLAALVAQLAFATTATAATVPTGFVEGTYVNVPSDVTAMRFARDGRLFVCEQSGQLRVVVDGTLLPTPFVTLPVDASGERGLLGVAFDPSFATNGFVYVYYTATTPTIHNRVSRFTANGNVAVAGSEFVVLDLPPLSSATHHNGGAIHFGTDGKLYVAVGDNGNGSNAQSLSSRLGKILRINRDGSIPADNPFYNTASGPNRAIWARGLRNPFTTALDRDTGTLFINDVGEQTYEEVNRGRRGANYGWPLAEGPSSNPDFTDPFLYYGRADGCAITGGAFYRPPTLTFPSGYHGDYFYADYCSGWIRRVDPVTGSRSGFATGISEPVDLKIGPDGALYYLSRGAAKVGRISYAAAEPPSITLQPASISVGAGLPATFSVSATGTTPLAYQWRRNGANISGATGSSYTLASAQLTDSGAFFDVRVSNTLGAETSETAQLTVLQNSVPAASITQPVIGTTYAGGDVISYAGTGSDLEDGTLPASAFTWWVNLHHDSHTHPFVPKASGAKKGWFTIPVAGETSPNVFYRIHLQVRDSGGLKRSVIRDVKPRKSTVTLAANPTGLQLRLDGQPVSTPYSFVGVEGIQRTLEAVSPQGALAFASWSDGGARVHTISTPVANTTYSARFLTQLRIADISLYEGNSGTKNAVFTVRLSAASTAPVSVAWKTTSGTAKSGSDYLAANGTLNFPAGTTSRTIAVAILGDPTLETRESFYVDLSAASGAKLADARAVGSILNDDGPGTIVFSASSYAKTESGGTATITVNRSGGLNGGMTVRYATSNGSATAGSDYTAASGTLTFGLGVLSMTFPVTITSDARDETDETVNLALSDPGGGAVLGTRRNAVLTILDNDSGGTLNFSVAAYERSEGGGKATIQVARSGGTASGVSVDYDTSNGTATATSDYTPASGTLLFAAGQATATFTITIRNDALNEANETVQLALSNPKGGARLGTRAAATLTIVDDD
jgi:glucose/arabinose dehydrogenase